MENNRLFCGNVPFDCTEQQLRAAFAAVAGVDSIRLIADRESGRFRGIAFVTMMSAEGAAKAVKELHGSVFGGRKLRVEIARSWESAAARV